jgi:hypothetical protein
MSRRGLPLSSLRLGVHLWGVDPELFHHRDADGAGEEYGERQHPGVELEEFLQPSEEAPAAALLVPGEHVT